MIGMIRGRRLRTRTQVLCSSYYILEQRSWLATFRSAAAQYQKIGLGPEEDWLRSVPVGILTHDDHTPRDVFLGSRLAIHSFCGSRRLSESESANSHAEGHDRLPLW